MSRPLMSRLDRRAFLQGTTSAAIAMLATGPSAADAKRPPFYRDKANLLVYLDGEGRPRPVQSRDDWAIRRAHILANFEEVAGPFPESRRRAALEPQIDSVETLAEAGVVRQHLTFAVEPGDRVSAYLLLPAAAAGPLPAMLCPHQTIRVGKAEPAGLEDSKKPYAFELAQRGYAALAIDYPKFGEYACDPYARGYTSATMKGIWNHIRGIDFLCSLEQVDARRIGALGHSLGGHNSIFAALYDERIQVVVSSCGFNRFTHYLGGDLAGWSHDGYMPRIRQRYGCDPEQMPFDFTELVAALAPRAFLAVAPLNDDNFAVAGVRECMAAAAPVYGLYGAEEKLAARHPDCGHDFPPELRREAYAWCDRWLKPAAG